MSRLLMFPSKTVPTTIDRLQACEDVEQQNDDGSWIMTDMRRQYTLLLLRRYFRMSIDMGRLPSLLGRNEFFRAKVSSYKASTFEDAVIFVHDMERSLEKVDEVSRRMIAGLVFLEYSRAEVADALGIYRTTVAKHYNAALDALGRILLDAKLINPADLQRATARKHRVNSFARVREFPAKKPCSSETCQEAGTVEKLLKASKERK
jgi:AraC-like DNA-binding protein